MGRRFEPEEWDRFCEELAAADGSLAFLLDVFHDNRMVKNALEGVRATTLEMAANMAESIVESLAPERAPLPSPTEALVNDTTQLAELVRATTGPRILIVDQDGDTAGTLAAQLGEFDFEPTVATSFGEVFAPLLQYGLAIVDVDMGQQAGFHVIRGLKRRPSAPVVLAHSVYGLPGVTVAAMREGADHFLLKPATIDEVILATAEAIGYRAVGMDYRPITLEEAKFEVIRRVYRQTGGNTRQTAELLGIDRKTVRRYIGENP